MTWRRGLRVALPLVVLAALVLPAAVGHASATALSVRAGSVAAGMMQRCQGSTVAVVGVLKPPTGTLSAVNLTGLDPVACTGRAVLVEVVDPSSGGSWASAVRATGTGTVAGATLTVTTSSFTPTSGLLARVVVGGWTVPSTWALTGTGVRCVDASGAGRSCTVVVDRYRVWDGGYRLDFHVTSTSTVAFRYEVQVDLSATGLDLGGTTGFPGWPVPTAPGHPLWYPAGLSPTNVCVASTSADLPVLRMRGSGAGWNDYVAAGSPVGSLGFQVADSSTFPTWAACTF